MKPAHSKIGASSMHRWAECPGSVRLSEGLESKQSKYAEEGTKAHELASRLLLNEPITEHTDDEMWDAVRVYVDYVESLKAEFPDHLLLVEHGFDLEKVHPGLFGTADCVFYARATKQLFVVDYKHGAGIPVEVLEEGKPNPQLLYYGLGAMMTLEDLEVGEVNLVIVQPRCNHVDGPVRSHAFDAFEMLGFTMDLIDFAKATEAPDAPLKSGDHCRFCPADGICPLLKEKALEVAKLEFGPQLSYDPEKLSDTLDMLDRVEAWAKSVREFAYAEANHGRIPPRYKLVAKRATRKWRDEDAAIDELILGAGLERADILETKLRSPAQIEKLLKKDQKPLLESLVFAVSSGASLVPETDPRAPLKLDAKSEFEVIETESIF